MNRHDDMDISTEEGMARFKQELERISEHVETWPEWKKQGWVLLDLKDPKEQ